MLPGATLVLALLLGSSGAAGERATSALGARVERAALAAAAERIAPPDRFDALVARFDGADRLPAGAIALELVEAEPPNRSGVMRLRFVVRVDGEPRGEARATVRGRVRGPVLVARTTLARGRSISSDAVERREADLTRLAGRPLRQAEELAGLCPTRTLGAGRELTRDLLRPTPLVHRGDRVDLRIEGRGLTVVAQGWAHGDGAPGERITAENGVTGARVLGEVQPDGTLLVIRGLATMGRR